MPCGWWSCHSSGDGKAEGHLLQTVAKGLGLCSMTVLGALIQSGPLHNFAAKLFILESVFCRFSQPNTQDYLPLSASMFSAVSLSLSLFKLPFFRWKGRWKGTGVGGCCVFVRCKWRAGSLTLFLRGVCRGFLGTAPGKGRWIKSCSILSPPQQHRDGFFRSLPKQDVSTNLTKTHLNKRVVAPLVNRDTTGCFAVSTITYCSVAWCLLPLHPFEYILLWKDDSVWCRKKSHFHPYTCPTRTELEFELSGSAPAFTTCLLFFR